MVNLSNMWHDARIAGRSLARQPAQWLMIAGILAVGIAGTATVFSLFNGVFLRLLPIPDHKDLWCPLLADPEKDDGGLGPMAAGRLRKGVTVAQARDDLTRIQRGWAGQHPGVGAGPRTRPQGGSD